MVLDRLGNYPSVSAACRDLAPKLNVGAETLRKWVMQAQADAGVVSDDHADRLSWASTAMSEPTGHPTTQQNATSKSHANNKPTGLGDTP